MALKPASFAPMYFKDKGEDGIFPEFWVLGEHHYPSLIGFALEFDRGTSCVLQDSRTNESRRCCCHGFAALLFGKDTLGRTQSHASAPRPCEPRRTATDRRGDPEPCAVSLRSRPLKSKSPAELCVSANVPMTGKVDQTNAVSRSASLVIASAGDRFTSRKEQEALLEILVKTEQVHAWPSQKAQAHLKETWGWDDDLDLNTDTSGKTTRISPTRADIASLINKQLP